MGRGRQAPGKSAEALRHLQTDIQARREGLLELVENRPAVPRGVRIVRWAPVDPPFPLNRFSTVTNSLAFIHATTQQLEHRLAGNDLLAGNWSPTELINDLSERVL
jgi:hypothetical protein